MLPSAVPFSRCETHSATCSSLIFKYFDEQLIPNILDTPVEKYVVPLLTCTAEKTTVFSDEGMRWEPLPKSRKPTVFFFSYYKRHLILTSPITFL